MAGRRPPQWETDLQDIEEEVEETEKEVEGEEEKLKQEEQEVEKDEKKEKQEIGEGESEGNIQELEDAEKKEKKLLEMLKNEEKLVDDIIGKIEKEIKGEMKEEQIMEKEIEQIFNEVKDSYQRLEKLVKNFKNIQKDGNQDFGKRNFRAGQKTLAELRDAAENFHKLLQYQERLIQELEETEEEEYMVEELEQRLEKELEMDKEEIKELINDFGKIGNEEDYNVAKKEGSELKNLLKHWKEETDEISNINNQIETEVEELQNLLHEDEEIMQKLSKALNLLEQLEKITKEQRGAISFVLGDHGAEELLEEIDKTREELEEILQTDKGWTDKMKDQYSTIEDTASKVSASVPTGPSARSAAGGVARASMNIGIMAVLGIVIFIVAILIYM